MRLIRRLWADEAGFVVSSELVLVATLLVIGLIVGLTSLRNQVVQELADTGAAIGMISQGYTFSGVEKIVTAGGATSTFAQTDGSTWDDQTDRCQTADGTDPNDLEPAGISVTSPTAGANVNTEL